MFRRIVLWYVMVAFSAACRYEAPPRQTVRPPLKSRTVWVRSDLTGKKLAQRFTLEPKVLTRCEAGSQLGADGLVAKGAGEFQPNDPIYLSMWLAQAPEGLQLALRVLDDDGNEVGTARRDDAGGVGFVTMEVGEPLEPGRYKLEGFWGGNLACEKAISVVGGVGGTAKRSEKP